MMIRKCENCIHDDVCRFREPEFGSCNLWRGWIHVDEALPRPCTRVIAVVRNEMFQFDTVSEAYFDANSEFIHIFGKVIAWMPMPRWEGE